MENHFIQMAASAGHAVAYTIGLSLGSGTTIDLQKMPIFAKKKNEAHFDLGGYVNTQNFCIWGKENPYAYIEKPAHPK